MYLNNLRSVKLTRFTITLIPLEVRDEVNGFLAYRISPAEAGRAYRAVRLYICSALNFMIASWELESIHISIRRSNRPSIDLITKTTPPTSLIMNKSDGTHKKNILLCKVRDLYHGPFLHPPVIRSGTMDVSSRCLSWVPYLWSVHSSL